MSLSVHQTTSSYESPSIVQQKCGGSHTQQRGECSTSSTHKLAHEVEFAGISLSPMKTDDTNGRKSVYVNMNGGKFQVQTPWLTSIRGVSLPPPAYADPANPKYSVRFSLDGYNREDSDVKDFAEMLQRFERFLIKEGAKNGMEWFKRKALSEEVIEQAMFSKMVKPCIDRDTGEISNKYPPSFDVKVNYYDGEWGCQFYNSKQEEITEDIPSVVSGRMRVRAIIECCPLWFMAGNKYGCKWKVTQLEYEPLDGGSSTYNLNEFAFDTTIPRSLSVNDLSFTDVKVNDKTNAKSVYINHNGGHLYVQTPWMTSYNGISLPPPEYSDANNPRYSVQWVLSELTSGNSDVDTFKDFLLGLDQRILEEAKTHSFEWLKKKSVSMDVLKTAMFTPQVKYREDKETGERLDKPPSFKASVPFYDGNWKCAVYNEAKERFTDGLDTVAGGTKIKARAILQCKGLWFIGGRFGCSWKVVQMEYNETTGTGPMQYAFRTPCATRAPLSQPAVSILNAVSSSEDEIEDSDIE